MIVRYDRASQREEISMAMIQAGELLINTHFVAAIGPAKSNLATGVHGFDLHMTGLPQAISLRFNSIEAARDTRQRISDGVP